jgi:hypothetical protein
LLPARARGTFGFPVEEALVHVRLLQVVFLLLVVAAAGAARGLATDEHSTAVPKAMVGCWARHVPALPVGSAAGTWLIRIRSSGAFAAYTPGSAKCDAHWDFTSHVSVAGGRMTIGHVPICAANGTYTAKATAKTLALRSVSDPSCSPRATLLNGTWRRKS